MSFVGQIFGREPELRTFEHSPDVVDNSCFVGVEVEVENIPNPREVDLWLAKRDGSLRNNGVEYVLRDPLNGADLIKAIRTLYKSLPNKADFSERCGLHVHLDVRSLSGQQFISYIYHVLLVERALYKYCGAGRDGNIFCIPHYKAPDTLRGLGALTSDNIGTLLPGVVRGASKYAGVNLAAVAAYGSVEFRMHKGTNSAERVLEWVNILLALRKHAVENSDIADAFLARVSSDGPKAFAERIFEVVPTILEFLDTRDLYDGIRAVQDYIEVKNLSGAAGRMPKKYTNKSLAVKFLKANGVQVPNQPLPMPEPESDDVGIAAERDPIFMDILGNEREVQQLRAQVEVLRRRDAWHFEDPGPRVRAVAAELVPLAAGRFRGALPQRVYARAGRPDGEAWVVVDLIDNLRGDVEQIQRAVIENGVVTETFF